MTQLLGWCCRKCDQLDLLYPERAPHSCSPIRRFLSFLKPNYRVPLDGLGDGI